MLRLVVAALLVPGALIAQQSFDGEYVFQSPAGAVSLTLQQQGNVVTGAMRGADGSVFQLQGELYAEGAAGQIGNDTGTGFFAVGFVDGGLKLIVAEVDPSTGQPDLDNGFEFDFTRVGAGGAVASQPTGAASPKDAKQARPTQSSPVPTQTAQAPRAPGAPAQGAQDAAVERDPGMIGYWTYTDTYSSGDFFANTRYQLQVNPDGSYLYGTGDVSLGGAYIGSTGGGGDVTRGEWRTQGGVVYVRDPTSPQWTPYARYYIEGGSMMFTFGDNSRQVWHRGG